MKNKLLTLVTLLAIFLFGAILVPAQDAPAAQDQAAPAAAKPAKAHHMAAKAESISGTISKVDAENHLVVVTGSDGVPYNFTVSKGTKITAGGSKAKLADLQTGKQATVSFEDMKKKGNWAKSIEVTG